MVGESESRSEITRRTKTRFAAARRKLRCARRAGPCGARAPYPLAALAARALVARGAGGAGGAPLAALAARARRAWTHAPSLPPPALASPFASYSPPCARPCPIVNSNISRHPFCLCVMVLVTTVFATSLRLSLKITLSC